MASKLVYPARYRKPIRVTGITGQYGDGTGTTATSHNMTMSGTCKPGNYIIVLANTSPDWFDFPNQIFTISDDSGIEWSSRIGSSGTATQDPNNQCLDIWFGRVTKATAPIITVSSNVAISWWALNAFEVDTGGYPLVLDSWKWSLVGTDTQFDAWLNPSFRDGLMLMLVDTNLAITEETADDWTTVANSSSGWLGYGYKFKKESGGEHGVIHSSNLSGGSQLIVGLARQPQPESQLFTPTASSNVSVTLSGQAATSALGTLTPASVIALIGQALTGSQGTVTVGADVNVTLTGTAATTSAGTIIPLIAPALSGQSATSAAGNITVSLAVTPTGQSVSGLLGTLVPAIDKALAGLGLTTNQGTLTPGVAVTLTGIQLTGSSGTVGTTGGTPVNTGQYHLTKYNGVSNTPTHSGSVSRQTYDFVVFGDGTVNVTITTQIDKDLRPSVMKETYELT